MRVATNMVNKQAHTADNGRTFLGVGNEKLLTVIFMLRIVPHCSELTHFLGQDRSPMAGFCEYDAELSSSTKPEDSVIGRIT
jgi:hypothetical protein